MTQPTLLPQNIMPLNRRVFVSPTLDNEVNHKGISMPTLSRDKPMSGKVIAVSEDLDDACGVKAGNTVYFGRYVGVELTHPLSKNKVLVIDFADLYGVSTNE